MYIYKKINRGNKISLVLKVEKKDINKNIYFLDNSNGLVYINDEEEEHYHDF